MTQDPMACQQLVELVTEYLEESLDPAQVRRFEAHLRTCDGCDRYLEQVRTTMTLSGQLRTQDLPGEVRGALLAAFQEWHDQQ